MHRLSFLGDLFLNRPAPSFTTLEEKLCESRALMLAAFQRKRDSAFNRRTLSHIIGIERWGQRRLRVLLGEPFVDEEYNVYRPDRDASWGSLCEQFDTTRTRTVRLLGDLAAANLNDAERVAHNDFGELTARGWLFYLHLHAFWTAKQIVF